MPYEALDYVLSGLMKRYRERVPAVGKVVSLLLENQLIDNESEIENDHIAFRSMGVPLLGIKSIDRIFTQYGYEKRDSYHFPAKKLDAFWYSPPEDKYPRIFISELRVQDLSQEAQAIIHSYTDEVETDPVDSLDLSQSVVSRHLAYLRNHQLVSTRRDGVWVYYQISAASAFVEQVLAVFSASASAALDLQADLQKVIDSEGKGCC